ncbi:hypothetical protein [Mesorhizobium sp. M1B.F.Ca.ET.045.04.1.1]|uniref:hypothetical protein n=1 Tax=Mesorhizobium sp. M1B.F.Ca.ET.045.04.1.1 TaxID=2493673 RepID=UPI000F74DCD3|nr:hypothetical protein [Mesorhizobium sp. M1B.F.Ca.ET.045.04.1.1]AZO29389.1 hypothetical protein EJ071_19680 [Mesorhizobium sp. M1B.F.Ca.ET.045.04.1.1]
MRLTKAQKQLLVEIANGDDRCSEAYNPARRLVDLGLVVWVSEYRLALTESGRAALSGYGGQDE